MSDEPFLWGYKAYESYEVQDHLLRRSLGSVSRRIGVKGYLFKAQFRKYPWFFPLIKCVTGNDIICSDKTEKYISFFKYSLFDISDLSSCTSQWVKLIGFSVCQPLLAEVNHFCNYSSWQKLWNHHTSMIIALVIPLAVNKPITVKTQTRFIL